MSELVNHDEDEIRQLDASWGDAASSGKLDAVISFYAPQGSVVWPGAPAAHGTDNIRTAWQGIFGQFKGLSLTFTPDCIDISHDGSMAADFGQVRFAYDTPQGRVEQQAKYVVVWTRVHGAWKVLYDCYNMNSADS